MHLLRCLIFYVELYHFDFVAVHLPGTCNTAADALSRNHLTYTLSFSHPTDPAMHNSTTSPGTAGGDQTQLGVSGVDNLVQELFDQGIARLVYSSGWRRYVEFCSKFSHSHFWST